MKFCLWAGGCCVDLPENGQSRYGKHDTGVHHVYHVISDVLQLDSSVCKKEREKEREHKSKG